MVLPFVWVRFPLNGTRSQENKQWVETYIPEAHGVIDITTVRADGDAELNDVDFSSFKIPDCAICGEADELVTYSMKGPEPEIPGSIIKPDFVFFGGSIGAATRNEAAKAVQEASAMLLLGTSVQVFSAYRLCRLAVEELEIPLAIVNVGETRADHLADLKVEGETQR